MLRHTLITGRSGSGKSKLMELLFYDLQRRSQSKRNFALIILDPHGDLAKTALRFAHNQDRDRLVYISSSINKEADTPETYSAVINPFDNDGSEDSLNILSQELADAFIELLSDTQYNFTPQMQAILRPCISTVLRSPNPSMETLRRFMLDGKNQDLIELGKKSPNPNHRDFFINDFHITEYNITKKSIRTKLTYFLGDQSLINLLTGKSTINLEKCLEEGKVIIFNLPKGSGKFTSSVFGRLMIAYIHSIFLRRDGLPREKRKQAFFIVDEFQTVITQSLSQNLAETRKYGLSMILATQSLKQIENTIIRKTIMVNTGVKAVAQTDYEDRATFSKELSMDIKDLEALEPLYFYVKNSDGKHTPFKFRVPILGKPFFLTSGEQKNLLNHIVYKSGMYKKIDLLPPAPVHEDGEEETPGRFTSHKQSEKKESKQADMQEESLSTRKRKKENPFDNDLKPAF